MSEGIQIISRRERKTSAKSYNDLNDIPIAEPLLGTALVGFL